MEKSVDTIKSLARKKQFAQSDILELVAACHGAAKLFTALIEEDGSASEVPKIKYLQEEVRKAHQSALTQKEPGLGEDSVRRLGECVNILEDVSRKVPTNKRLQFTPAPTGGAGTTNDGDAPAAGTGGTLEAENNGDVADTGLDTSDEEGDEEEEVDSEAEYLAAIEAERVSFMGRAAWHVRMLHLLTAVVLILACVGVVFVSSDQYDRALEDEKRENMVKLLNVALDGLDVIASLSTEANLVTASERFLDELANLRTSLTAAPTVSLGSQFLFEYITVRYTVDIANGDRAFNRFVPRTLRLLCLDDDTITVTSNNDLRYGVNRTKNVLHSDECKTQTSGSGIWRRIGPAFLTYLPAEPTYRGVLAHQVGTLHSASGLGVAVQVERDTLQATIAPNGDAVGVQNPLKADWQTSTAMWSSFAIAVGLLLCVVASEGALWAAREEYLTDAISVCVYAVGVGLISLVVVITTAAISWSFLSDALDAHRLQQQQAVAKIAAAAAISPTVQGLGGSLLLVDRMINSALNNTMCTTNVATGAVYPPSPTTNMASWLSNAYALKSSGDFYTSGTHKTSSGKLLLTSTYYLADVPVLMTLYRVVEMSNVIIDAGKRSAGPTLGVLGAQLVLALVYYTLTPLHMLWPYAGGAVWVEELLRPCNVRRVLYAVVAAVTFATSLAVAFYAVGLLTAQQSEIAATSGLSMAQALSVTATATAVEDLSVLNAGLPSFADAIAFVTDTIDRGSFVAGKVPDIMPGQSPRFGIPAWSGWEANFYGAALALSNLSTSVMAPAYFTLDVTDSDWSLSEPGNIAYMQTSTAVDASGSYGVALQRFPASYEATPLMAYRIYASFVFAAVFAVGIACVVYEVAYRAASKVRSEDEYDEPSPVPLQSVAMGLILLLPAFAVLAGAGGSATTMRDTLDEFASRELSWQVSAMKPVLEHVAETQLSNSDNIVFDTMATFVNLLNDRAASTLTTTYTRWILLQETSDFTLSKVFPIGGTDTQNSFYMSNLGDMQTTPHTGTISTGFFYATTPRIVAYAAIEILSGLNALSEPKPATFLMLVSDQHHVSMFGDNAVTQLYKVAGTCVVVLSMVFFLAYWYIYQLSEKKDFPVVDDVDVALQPLRVSEDDVEGVAPPAMPRQLRLAHVFFFIIAVAVLVFFTASITYGAQMTRMVMEHASMLIDAEEHFITTAYHEVDVFWHYLITSIGSQSIAFKEAVVEESKDKSYAGLDWLNATGVDIVAGALNAIADSGTKLEDATTLFDVEDLVLSFSNSYHMYALKSFHELDRLDDVFYQLESVVGRLQVSAQRIVDSSSNASAPVPPTYNITAVATALHATSVMVDLSIKFSILDQIAINTLLDFSDTITDPKKMFELSADGAAVKGAVRAAATALLQRLDDALEAGLTGLLNAYSDNSGAFSTAREVLRAARNTIVATCAVLTPTSEQWTKQQKRIEDVFNTLYGDNGTFATARAFAAQTAISNAGVIIDAVRWEAIARKNKDFEVWRVNAASSLPGPMYPTLAPWSATERVHVVHDVDNFLITATATTVVALVLLGAGFAAVSWLSYQRVASDAQASASVSMSIHRTGDDDGDMDALLTGATDKHYAAHLRTVRWVTTGVLLLCVPVGMALWVAREGTHAASAYVEEGHVALSIRKVVEELPMLTEQLLYEMGAGFAVGDLSDVQASVTKFDNVMIDAQKLIVRRHREALRKYQASGYDLSVADTERVRVAIVRSNLQEIRDLLAQVNANISYEAALYTASLSQPVNQSNPIIIQQRLAAVAARRLVGAALSDMDAVLAPISPFGTTSSLATYVQERYASLLANASAATTQASKRQVIAQLGSFSTLLSEAETIPRGFINYWHLQTATFQDNDDLIAGYGKFDFLSAAYLASKGTFPLNVRNDIAATFLRIWQLMTPTPSAAQALFSTTPLLPWSTTFSASTDLADGILAAAAASTYFKGVTTAPLFQQLYAFNRRLYTSAQLSANTKFSVPLLDLIDRVPSTLKNLSTWDPDIRNTSQASVQQSDTTSYFKGTVNVLAYGTENPEYVSVAVEWVCAAAFWLAFVALALLVVDLRVLHV